MLQTTALKIIQLATKNKKGYPFSACIEYKGKMYWAVNEVISKNDPTAHAEIQAIRYACKEEKREDLRGGKIYCSGEPCGMCLNAIAWSGIKGVYYINSWRVAKENNDFYDTDSIKINKFLNLKLRIKQI